MSSRRRKLRMGLLIAALSLLVSPATRPWALVRGSDADSPFDATALEFFEKQVRPILVKRCHECHGGEKQKGNLRLDSRQGALTGGDTGPAITPGKPDDSLLIDAIRYGDTYQMPPKSQLPADEVAALTEWVRLGAPWPSDVATDTRTNPHEFDFAARAAHWCFQPLSTTGPPEVRAAAWPRTAIDRFVLARLEGAGVEPAPAADKRTLIRRVTFDLIGLPPTPAEIADFLADDSPAAFAKVVDRLLASPHYGERWARHWLDLVRFAETYGHEFDFTIPNAYRYRDYVIRAFNADVPYDQFLLEHLAGDLLQPPRINARERINESIIGTGFFLLGEAKHSPVDVRQDESDRVDNQIDVFAKTFLALTVSCARCHDHKFDAITTKDYYALAGYLQSSRSQQAFIDLPEVFAPHLERLSRVQHRQIEAMNGLRSAVATNIAAIIEQHFSAATIESAAREALERTDDPLYPLAQLLSLPGGLTIEQFTAERIKRIEPWKEQLSQSELPADARLFADFRGDDYAGWFVTGQAFGTRPGQAGEPQFGFPGDNAAPRYLMAPAAHSGLLASRLQGTLRSPTFTIESPRILYKLAGTGGRLRLIVDGLQLIQDPIYGGLQFGPQGESARWHVQDVSKWVGHNAYIELLDTDDRWIALEQVAFAASDPRPAAPNATIVAALDDAGLTSAVAAIDRCRSTLRQVLEAWATGSSPPLHRDSYSIVNWALTRLAAKSAELPQLHGALDARIALNHERREIEAMLPEPRLAIALADGTGENEAVFIRGSHKNLGDMVPRRNLQIMSGVDQPAPHSGSGRLDWARRIVDGSQSLVSRVLVNRIWKHHFGEGIVATPDDFGSMGQPPRNRELLDHLASEFVRDGWSIKQLHRQIVLSSTYQMSSERRPAVEAIDPQNHLPHRSPIRRIEAESIRDAMLTVSGRLDATLLGPSIPPYLTEFMVGRGRPDKSGPLDGAGRRTIYITVRRNFLTPMLTAFDYPTPFTTIGRRTVSNVPAQALTMLNNPFVAEQAAHWARRVLNAGYATDALRIQAMYETAFARPPQPHELDAAEQFLRQQAGRYPTETEVKALADLAQVLLNVKEFIFVN